MEFPKVDEVYKLLSEKLESWIEGGITLLPNIVVAFIIAILFGIIAKVVGKDIQSAGEAVEERAEEASN